MRFRPHFLFKRGFKGLPPPPIAEQVRDRWTKSICRRSLNVLNVLCRRFEESQCDREFINSFNNLLAEIHSIYGRFEAVILTNADQYNDEVSVCRFPNNIPVEVTWGRPKLQITRVEVVERSCIVFGCL